MAALRNRTYATEVTGVVGMAGSVGTVVTVRLRGKGGIVEANTAGKRGRIGEGIC